MIRVNLIPEKDQIARIRRQHLVRWMVASACAVAALALVTGTDWVSRARADELQAEQARLQSEFARARAELRELTSTSKLLRSQVDQAEALHAKRAWSGMIAMIASHLPQGAWLTSVETDPEAPRGAVRRSAPVDAEKSDEPQAVVIDAPTALMIHGYAPQARDPVSYIAALKAEHMFREVALVRSRREPVLDGSYFRFELICRW
ncbi:MAG: hypothetical protein ACE5E5_06935 [Phycisphaerae bacterium]